MTDNRLNRQIWCADLEVLQFLWRKSNRSERPFQYICICYGSEFCEQREGATIGSHISAVVANLYVESFEELVMSQHPRLWKRYVKDTFCIHLKSIRLTINFNMEGGSPLPRYKYNKEDGKLDITVYRRHRQLHSSSNT